MKKILLFPLLALMISGCQSNIDSSTSTTGISSTAHSSPSENSSTPTPSSTPDVSSLPENTDTSGLLILQVYGVGAPGGTNDPALSHSFVELYNPTDVSVSLSGYTLQYSEGGSSWSKLALTGNIPSKSSYLILANAYGTSTVHQFDTSKADMVWNGQVFNNKGVKVCLIKSLDTITVSNPFNNGNPIDHYTDLVGATGRDETIDGSETKYIEGQSKQKAVRRKSLIDTHNNSVDFGIIDFSALPSILMNDYLPRSSKDGAWNPISETPAIDPHLMILQVYGTGGKGDSAISHSFVELYNPTEEVINLVGYSLQYGDIGNTWTRINLTGTIKPSHSYLILGARTDGTVLTLDEQRADLVTSMQLDNKNNKVALVSATDSIGIANPVGISSLVDLVGTGETDAYETAPITDISKQKTVRRISLIETNNNFFDFETIRFPDLDTSSHAFDVYRPKHTGYGAWEPML